MTQLGEQLLGVPHCTQSCSLRKNLVSPDIERGCIMVVAYERNQMQYTSRNSSTYFGPIGLHRNSIANTSWSTFRDSWYAYEYLTVKMDWCNVSKFFNVDLKGLYSYNVSHLILFEYLMHSHTVYARGNAPKLWRNGTTYRNMPFISIIFETILISMFVCSFFFFRDIPSFAPRFISVAQQSLIARP